MWLHAALDAIDLSILEFLAAHRDPTITWLAVSMGVVGTNTAVLGAIIGLGLLATLVTLRWRPLAAMALAVVSAKLLIGLLKNLIERSRPPAELVLFPGEGPAFPSTHAAFTIAAVTALLTVVVWRSAWTRGAVLAICTVLVLAVGLAMVYLGSHWAGDVIAGWLLGTPLGWLMGRLLRPRPPEDASRGIAPALPRESRDDAPRQAIRRIRR